MVLGGRWLDWARVGAGSLDRVWRDWLVREHRERCGKCGKDSLAGRSTGRNMYNSAVPGTGLCASRRSALCRAWPHPSCTALAVDEVPLAVEGQTEEHGKVGIRLWRTERRLTRAALPVRRGGGWRHPARRRRDAAASGGVPYTCRCTCVGALALWLSEPVPTSTMFVFCDIDLWHMIGPCEVSTRKTTN